MPTGRWPDQVGPFQKWATDQVKRGSVAGNKVSSRGKKWRMKRRKRRKNKDG